MPAIWLVAAILVVFVDGKGVWESHGDKLS